MKTVGEIIEQETDCKEAKLSSSKEGIRQQNQSTEKEHFKVALKSFQV